MAAANPAGKPRIALTKLGEYLVAPPIRRRRILLDQKQPKTFIVATYQDAFDAITNFIVGDLDEDGVIKLIDDLLADSEAAQTDWHQQRAQLCAAAIESFLEISDSVVVDPSVASRGDPTPPHFAIGGVSVSVRPEVTIRSMNAKGEVVHGAIKLYLSKENPLGADSGSSVATVLSRYVDSIYPGEGKADPHLCWVIDVFAGEIFVGTKSYKRVMHNLEAACEEIVARWHLL